MRTVIRNRLANDSTLQTLLTGGVYDAATLPEGKLSLSFLEEAGKTDGYGRLLPCAALIWREALPDGAGFREEATTLHIWLYEYDGNANLIAASKRIKELLHRWTAGAAGVTTNESLMEIRFIGGIEEFIDPDLNANGSEMRFRVKYIRK